MIENYDFNPWNMNTNTVIGSNMKHIYNQYNIYILFNFSYLIKVNVNYQVD